MLYAPYLPNRPAWAIANGSRYFALNCPNPPRRHASSPNSFTASIGQESAAKTTGTGCQVAFQLARRRVVARHDQHVRLHAGTCGMMASKRSIISTLAAKLPSSPVESVYL